MSLFIPVIAFWLPQRQLLALGINCTLNWVFTSREICKPTNCTCLVLSVSSFSRSLGRTAAAPPWFNCWFSFTLAYSRISHEYSYLLIIVINLIFMFLLWCIDWAGSLYANHFFLCISVLRVASGPRVKLASCKSALNPTVVCCTDHSKALVPVLVLLFVALWFILQGDLLYVFPCVILFLCFSVLLVLRLPRFGKRELILVLFIRLSGLCLFWFVGYLFLLGSGKGCGLWLWHSLDFSLTFFVIVALPELFSYLFFQYYKKNINILRKWHNYKAQPSWGIKFNSNVLLFLNLYTIICQAELKFKNI